MACTYDLNCYCSFGTVQVCLQRPISSRLLETESSSYICQYIELSAMSPRRSAIWLGIQFALALLRVTIWVVDPGVDDLKDESEDAQSRHAEPIISMSEETLLLLRLSKLHASNPSTLNSSTSFPSALGDVESRLPHHGNPLAILNWVLPALDLCETKLTRTFELAYSLYSSLPKQPHGNLRWTSSATATAHGISRLGF